MSQVSIRGNTTAPVEVRYTQSGKAVASVTVAENIGKDDQKRTNFHRITLWGEMAEHAAQLDKGTSVIVIGRLDQREYDDKDGNRRTTWEVTADAFGPDLRFQTVQVSKSGAGASQGGAGQPQSSPVEPWSTPGVSGAQNATQGEWTGGEFDDSSTPF